MIAALAFATVIVTTSLLNPAKDRRHLKRVLAQARQMSTIETHFATRKDEAHRVPEFVPSPTHIASANLLGMTAQARGRFVHVTANAYLFDRRPQARFLWSIRIFDIKDRLISKKDYLHQIFTIPIESKPFFEDVIELAPGSYRVSFALVYVGSDAALKQLDNLAALKAFECLSMSKGVKVAAD